MTAQETLLKYVSDMYSLEDHIIQPLKSQAKDQDMTPYPEAMVLVERILASSETTLPQLEALARSLGGEARSGIKSAVAAVAGVAAATLNEARAHAITKKLRDDCTALSLAALGYELLHTTANALGSPQIAAFSLNRLKEIATFVRALSHEIIPVAVKELSRSNEVDALTIALSQKNVKGAWTPS